MTEVLQDYPVVSVDIHLRNVPGFESIDVDMQRYGAMLIELGVSSEKAGSNNNIYIRPDYALAYTRTERIKKFLNNPWDYTDAGSCVKNNDGGVDIVLVYGSGYGINKLLRHETYHAIQVLTENTNQQLGLFSAIKSVISARKIAEQEEKDADRLMKDEHLKSEYGKIVRVERFK